jgi:hypothetical protein
MAVHYASLTGLNVNVATAAYASPLSFLGLGAFALVSFPIPGFLFGQVRRVS